MDRKYVAFAFALLASVAIAATAFGTTAQQAAQPAKLAQKALKKANKALAAANSAAATAGGAKTTADSALGAATGPAGGDLAGSFPNPTIAPGSVDITEISENALNARAFARIDDDGTVITRNNIVVETAGKVEKPGTGVYCLQATADARLIIGNSAVVLTPSYDSSSTNLATDVFTHMEWRRTPADCDSLTDYQIVTFRVDLGTGDLIASDEPFNVAIFSDLLN